MKAALPAAATVLAAAAALYLPAAAPAQETAPAERIQRIIVYGDDPCPVSTPDDIVVCARRDETERYRVPEELRDDGAGDAANLSWAARAKSLEYVGRTGIQSCSTVGPGGFTGCWDELVRAWRGEPTGIEEPGR